MNAQLLRRRLHTGLLTLSLVSSIFLLPQIAAAQPTGYMPYQPPAGYTPTVIPSLERYSRYRASWYFGVGFGGGAGWLSDNEANDSDKKGGLALSFKIGGLIRPWFLLGFDASAWRYQKEGVGVQFNHYDAVATFFPIYDAGLYFKAGGGLGISLVDYGSNHYQSNDAGGDVKAGLGYEFQVGQSFNLGADFTLAVTKYEGGRTNDFAMQLTGSWY